MRCISSRRGQATSFVVLGLIILAVVILLVYMRGQFLFGPVTVETLDQKGLSPIREHITSCVEDVAPNYFERIGLQGGYLSTPVDTYRNIDSIPISYLCYNMEENDACYSRYLTRSDMETQLAQAIRQGLSGCINLQAFSRGVELTAGSLAVDVAIGDYTSSVKISMPLKLQKGDVLVEEDTFITTLDIPLGALYDVSRDVLDGETTVGEFDQLGYMLTHQGNFVIDKKRPYPDKLYILQTKDSPYVFQFFVQGEPS